MPSCTRASRVKATPQWPGYHRGRIVTQDKTELNNNDEVRGPRQARESRVCGAMLSAIISGIEEIINTGLRHERRDPSSLAGYEEVGYTYMRPLHTEEN